MSSSDAGRDQDVVAVAVHLDPDAVELGVDRDRAPPPAFASAAGEVGGAGGQHRQHRPADLEPERRQRLLAAVERRDRATATVEPASIAARRTAASGTSAATASRLLHQRVERALADRAGDHAAQPGLLVGGRPAEQVGDRGGPGRLRARARPARRAASNASCTSATVSVGDVGRRRAASASPRQPSPVRRWRSAPPRYAVTVSTSSGAAAREQRGDRRDLGLAGPGGGDRRRRWRRRRRAACGHSTGPHRQRRRPAPPRLGSVAPMTSAADPGSTRVWRPGWPCPVGPDAAASTAAAPATRRTASTARAGTGAACARPRVRRRWWCATGPRVGEVHARGLGSGRGLGARRRCPTCSAPTTTRPASSRGTRCWSRPGAATATGRVGRSGLVMEALVPAILEQKVTGQEAFAGFRMLVHRYGERAPGPGPRRCGCGCSPTPSRLRAVPSWEWLRMHVDPARSRTLVTAARVADVAGAHRRAAARRGRPPAAQPARASACGPAPRCASARTATPTRCRSATTTWPRTSAGR